MLELKCITGKNSTRQISAFLLFYVSAYAAVTAVLTWAYVYAHD